MERNRDRLAAVPAQQGDIKLARLLELLDEIVQTRDKLAELRAAETWARLFPHEQATREPMTRLFGGGLKHAMEPLGLNVQIDYAKVIDTLRADAEWLRHAAAGNEQRAALEGRDPRESNGAHGRTATSRAPSGRPRSRPRSTRSAANGTATRPKSSWRGSWRRGRGRGDG